MNVPRGQPAGAALPPELDADTPEIAAPAEEVIAVAVPDADEPPPLAAAGPDAGEPPSLAAASGAAAVPGPDRPAERRPRRDAGPRVAASDEPPPTGTSGATGRVHVSASGGGWADVFADGRRVGRTPVRAVLPIGRHTLRFLPLGQEPAQTQIVDIERGDELLLRLTISNE